MLEESCSDKDTGRALLKTATALGMYQSGVQPLPLPVWASLGYPDLFFKEKVWAIGCFKLVSKECSDYTSCPNYHAHFVMSDRQLSKCKEKLATVSSVL